MTIRPDPTACAEDTAISGDTLMPDNWRTRCPDCGHLVINHPYPGGKGCELCQIEARFRSLKSEAYR